MTIEEKATAYDELLKKIQPLYNQAKKDDSPLWATYEYLVPQLAENEDEKTRKFLIDFVKLENGVNLSPDDAERCIAYLEKQKEQKTAEWSEEDRKMLDSIVNVLESMPSASFIPIKRETMIPWLKFLPERFNLLPKQEWSEEDEKMLKDTIREFHLAYPYAFDDENPRKKNIDWLKSLPERFNFSQTSVERIRENKERTRRIL